MAGGQQHDNSNDSLLYAVAIAVVVVAIWWFFGKYISAAYIMSKKMEYYVLKYTFIPELFTTQWTARILPVEPFLLEPSKEALTFGRLGQVGSAVGYFSRWYYVAILGFIGYRILLKNPLQKFRRSHSMKTLVESEQRLWPAIAPVAKLNLVKQDIDKGPWAMSRKPLDFARYYKLLDEGNVLNRDRSEKLFAMQLGKLWEGTGKLPPYARALFACFAAQACGEIAEAKVGLDKLSIAMSQEKTDYVWVSAMLAKYEKDERVQRVIKSHAYVYTVMASMLKAAREFGVMQSPQFIWLRPKNRHLWYTLNGVGRRVAFAEIAGIYAHWIAEEVAGHPIERPYVSKAVDGLTRALLEVIID